MTASSLPSISDAEFSRIQRFVYEVAGIALSDAKRALVVARLAKRLRELGCATFGAYYEIASTDSDERTRMIDAICTNETHFFRDQRQFTYLAETLLPRWQRAADAGERPRSLRFWSAACSTGEEPFSIAMTVLEALDPARWDIEIVASDISTRVLSRASAAVWPIDRASEIPPHLLGKYMLRGVRSEEGRIAARGELRSMIRFTQLNLNGQWPGIGTFDAIFCRNVLIYFDRETKLRVISRLLDQLAPGGKLFLGHAESLSGVTSACSVGPSVYARRDDARIVA